MAKGEKDAKRIPVKDGKLIPAEMDLTGRLVTSSDGVSIGPNFKSLKNMRYTDSNPEGINGMSKINTTVITTYTHIRNGIHFKKDQPAESHIIVQAEDSGAVGSRVLHNNTAIPDQGDFESTAIYTDAAGAGRGYFSKAPSGSVVYCNGVETLIWGGDEHWLGAAINAHDTTFSNDFTEQMNNSRTDADDIMVITNDGTDSDIEIGTIRPAQGFKFYVETANTTSGALAGGYILSGASWDALTGEVDGTDSGGISMAQTGSITFDGANLVSDTQDWTANTDESNVDYTPVPPAVGDCILGKEDVSDQENLTAAQAIEYSHGTYPEDLALWQSFKHTEGHTTQLKNIKLYLRTGWSSVSGTITTYVEVWSAGKGSKLSSIQSDYFTEAFQAREITFDFSGDSLLLSNNTEYWIKIYGDHTGTGSGDAFNQDSDVYSNGQLDRYADQWYYDLGDLKFEVRMEAYSSSGYIQTANIDVGQTPPNDGTWTLSDTTPDNSTVTYVAWASDTGAFGGEETSLGTIVDQDDITVKERYYRVKATLNANSARILTPTVHDIYTTFPLDAFSAATPQLNKGRYLYWYKFEFTNLDATTAISQITADMAFQPIRDLWDGIDRRITYFKEEKASNDNNEYTVQVYEETYVSTNEGTYADIGGLTTATEDIVVGFLERMTGIQVGIVGGAGNDVAATLSGEYWNGTTWAGLTTILDSTKGSGSAAFNATGVFTWVPASISNEFMKVDDKLIPMFMYRFKFTGTLSANCKVFYIGGIPAEKSISGYKFPIFAHNRLMLCNDQYGRKNEVLIGAQHSPVVFNGDDSAKIYLGNEEELIAGASIYNQFGSELYSITAFFKENETWVITGDDPNEYRRYRVSGNIGISAPLTLTSINIPPEANEGSFNVLVFQGHDNIYIFDGKTFRSIGDDIDDLFDVNSTTYVNPAKKQDSYGFYDDIKDEWHWLFAANSSTDINKEFVYDFKRGKWYEISRGSGKEIQCGFSVMATDGNKYNYAGIDTGYLERLENGTTMDGDDITFELTTGDVALAEGSQMYQTQIRHINLIAKAKTNTSNSINITHYGDTDTTGSTAPAISPISTGKRIAKASKSVKLGNHVFHSLKMTMTTNDEVKGFEPLWLGVFYKIIREDL